MQPLAKLAGYLTFVLLVSALLAPPLYWLGRAALADGWAPFLKGVKFSSYFNRAVLVVVLLSLVPFLRWLGFRRWSDLGLRSNPRRWSDLALGVAAGAIGLYLVAAGLLFADQAELKTIRWLKLLPILATAVVVPIIEEILFRGVLYGALRRAMDWRRALVVVSLIFAAAHYLGPPHGAPKLKPIEWTSGFVHLPRLVWQYREPLEVLPGLVTLFCVGMLLAYTVEKTRSLYLAMGLHGGWVFALRSYERFSRPIAEPTFWVGEDPTTGLVPVLLVLCSWAGFVLLLRRRARSPAAEAPADA